MTARMSAAAYRQITVKPKRKPPRHLESKEQAAVILWARARFEEDPARFHDLDLLHCSLNGVRLTQTQARIAKGQGMKPGIPDLSLPVPRAGYHGLYLEMKREDGVPSDVTADQKAWHARLRELGYKVVVAYGAGQAKQAIRDYYMEPSNGQ